MKHPKTNEDKINKFLEIWSREDLIDFINELDTLRHVFGDDDDPDFLKRVGGNARASEIKIVCATHLISRLCDKYAGKMSVTKMTIPNLWLELERSIEAERAKKNDSDD